MKSKFDGGALMYALFVITVISSVLVLITTMSYYNKVDYINFEKDIRAIDNSLSGIHLLLSETPPVELNEKKQLDLFEKGRDSVQIERKSWGLYEVIISRAKGRLTLKEKTAFIGSISDDNTALYLSDRNKPLSIAGKTKIKGECHLPKKGVKRAYINNKPYVGDKLIYGNQEISNKNLPELKIELLSAIENQIENKLNTQDSIVHFEDVPDSIYNSFSNTKIVLISSSIIDLNNKQIKGNVELRSSNAIYVRKNTVLENSLLIAPFIYVEDSFTGNIQAFASDSIWVGENAELEFPSVLSVFQKEKKEVSGQIIIGEKVKLTGTVLCYQKNYDFRKPVRLHVGQGSEIEGTIYVNGQVELKGNVWGSLYCNNFSLKTPATVYENHLIDVEIDNSKRFEEFAGPILFEKGGKRIIIEWLN